jgi:hypothetical protein
LALYAHLVLFLSLRDPAFNCWTVRVHLPLTLLTSSSNPSHGSHSSKSGVSFFQIRLPLLQASLFEKQCTAWKRQSWYSPAMSPLSRLSPPLCNRVYKPDTIRNLQRTQDATTELRPPTQLATKNKPSSTQLPLLNTSVAIVPSDDIYKACFVPQSGFSYTHPRTIQLTRASLFVGRNTASSPSTHHTIILIAIPVPQETGRSSIP